VNKLHWSVDSLVLRDNVIFGFGWLFHEDIEIQTLKLVVHFSDGKTTCTISADYGKSRSDVAQIFKNYYTAHNAGYVIYGSCLRGADEWVKVFLMGTLANGDIFNLEIPFTSLSNLDSQPAKAERKLMARLFKRCLQLVKQGQISSLIDKSRRHLKSRPKSHLDSAREIYTKLIANERKNVVLIVDHDLGGGANLYRERLVAEKVNEENTVLILSYHVGSLTHVLTIRNKRLNESYSISGVDFVLELAQIISFREVIYNNAVSFVRPEEIPQLLFTLKTQYDCCLKMLVHDFFMVCPSPHLLDDHGAFCEIPSISKCQQCLRRNQQGFATLFSSKDITLWRSLWGMAIQAADEIVVFSKSSLQLISRAYPEIDKSRVAIKPHKVEYLRCGPIQPNYTDTLRLGIVGQIGYHKGAQFVRELSQEIKRRGDQTQIVIIGSIETKCDSSVVKQTGPYQRDQLPDLIRKSNTNVMLFPSICPETFSYIVHELIELELPVACFDIGAQAERVTKYSKGLILKKPDASSVLDALIDFHKQIYLEK